MKKINLSKFFIEDLEITIGEKKLIVKRHNLVINCAKFFKVYGMEEFQKNFGKIFTDNCVGELEILEEAPSDFIAKIYIDATKEYEKTSSSMGLGSYKD